MAGLPVNTSQLAAAAGSDEHDVRFPPFYPSDSPVPAGVETAVFHLTPLTPAHVELDYAALMVSKPMLRRWSGSPWPQDDFTLADNLADLEWHDAEHRERVAFTYTVLNPAQTICLGCVYINPLAQTLADADENAALVAQVGAYETAVRCWIAQPHLAADLDAQLLSLLIDWFRTDWPFRRVTFHAHTADTRPLTLFAQAGLTHAFTARLPRRGGRHQFWA